MATLQLAANYINWSGWLASGDGGFGHLQIVNSATGAELEVQAPWTITAGSWIFEQEQDHATNTNNVGEEEYYQIVDIDLNGRYISSVWNILEQINSQYISQQISIEYDYGQDSNSYATTLLAAIGINVLDYIDDVRPPAVVSSGGPVPGFPGAGVNVLQNPLNPASASAVPNLEITGGASVDIVRTGLGQDTVVGNAGADDLQTHAGDDRLAGDIVHLDTSRVAGFWIEDDYSSDILNGGSGYDLYGVAGDHAFALDDNGFDFNVLSIVDRIVDPDGIGEIWTQSARDAEDMYGTAYASQNYVIGATSQTFTAGYTTDNGVTSYWNDDYTMAIYRFNDAEYGDSLAVSTNRYGSFVDYVIAGYSPGDFDISFA